MRRTPRVLSARSGAATGLVLVALVASFVVLGAAVRLPCRDVCGSDIARLYEARHVDRDHAPFLDRELEYPPLIGLVMYAAGVPFDGALRASFLLNVFVLSGLAALTTWVLWRRYGLRVRRWVFAPPLLLEGVVNWDLLAVAPTTIGLVRWEAGSAFWAGVLIGVGAGAKLFPALYVPILAAACLPLRAAWRACKLVAGFVAGVGVFALPVSLLAPQALRHFLDFHGARKPTWGTIWFYVLRDPGMHPWVAPDDLAGVGTIITSSLVALGLAVLVVCSLRGRADPLVACALATVLFVVANKVYSPQYDLWLVPFLVMLPVCSRVVVHLFAASVAVFLASYALSHVIETPAFLYIMGAAVVYRLWALALLMLDCLRISAARCSCSTRT